MIYQTTDSIAILYGKYYLLEIFCQQQDFRLVNCDLIGLLCLFFFFKVLVLFCARLLKFKNKLLKMIRLL